MTTIGVDDGPEAQLALDGWAPELGTAIGSEEMAQAPGSVDVDVEVADRDWGPVSPPDDPAAVPAAVRFVDGVRRIEGVLWRTEDGRTRKGLVVSLAAGSVHCHGPRAEVTHAEVQRLLIGPAGFPELTTRAGTFAPRAVADDDADTLRNGAQQRLRRLERRILQRLDDSDLVVLDGPLDASVEDPRAVGYVKTHHVAYLPETVTGVVAALAAGQRTPLFLATSSWSRYSWYLRLPYGAGHPWAGVVRCEASADLPVADARRLAEATTACLPRFASRPHKDQRAPQNLYPIGGLERHLKRLLGDAGHVLRCLRTAVNR